MAKRRDYEQRSNLKKYELGKVQHSNKVLNLEETVVSPKAKSGRIRTEAVLMPTPDDESGWSDEEHGRIQSTPTPHTEEGRLPTLSLATPWDEEEEEATISDSAVDKYVRDTNQLLQAPMDRQEKAENLLIKEEEKEEKDVIP